MTQSTPPERGAGPGASLDERILRAEQAVVRRDERVHEALRATLARSRGAVVRQRDRLGVGLAAVAALGALALLLRRLVGGRQRRAGPPRGQRDPRAAVPPHARHTPHGRFDALGRWLVLVAPLLPAPLRRWVPASGRFSAAGLLLPALPLLRQALPGLGTGTVFGPPPPTVAALDLQRFGGAWHELARFPSPSPSPSPSPTPSESGCARDTRVHCTPLDSGEIAVVNTCIGATGREKRLRGTATVVPGSGNAKLRLSFVPAWLRWLPFAWADCWVLHVDAGYRHALVGTPDRRQLWLLARTPAADRAALAELVGRAVAAGYDVERLERTPRSGG